MRIARSVQHLTPTYANIGKVYHTKMNSIGDIYTLSDNGGDHLARAVEVDLKNRSMARAGVDRMVPGSRHDPERIRARQFIPLRYRSPNPLAIIFEFREPD
ncbi:hypothetical protein SH139x_004264 [Planctomycetaceae bacterium SH139]